MQKFYELELNDDIELGGRLISSGKALLARWSKNNTKFLILVDNEWLQLFEKPYLGDGYGFRSKLQYFGLQVIRNVYYKGYQPVGEEIIPVKTGGIRIRVSAPNALISHTCSQVNFGNKNWYTMLSKNEKCPVCNFQHEEERYYI